MVFFKRKKNINGQKHIFKVFILYNKEFQNKNKLRIVAMVTS